MAEQGSVLASFFVPGSAAPVSGAAEQRHSTLLQHLDLSHLLVPDPFKTLLDLRIKKNLTDQIEKSFGDLGFKLEEARVKDPYGSGERRYICAHNKTLEIALLELPRWIVENPNFVGPLAQVEKAFQGKVMRLFAEGVDSPVWGVRKLLQEWEGDDDSRCKFVPWRDLASLKEGVALADLLNLDLGHGAPQQIPRSIGDEEQQIIVEILSRLAAGAPQNVGVKGYFRARVLRQIWPVAWKEDLLESWTGHPRDDANNLVTRLINWRTFPTGHVKSGESVIGCFLWELISVDQIAGPDDSNVARIILSCGLVSGQLLEEVKTRYQN